MTLILEFSEGEPDSCGHYLAEVLQRNHYALEPYKYDKWSWRVLWYRPDWPEGERWECVDETMTVRRWSKLPSEADMLDIPLRWGAPHRERGPSCHDCGAKPGEIHMDGCDVERCPDCGRQFISCGCEEITHERLPWDGEWHGRRRHERAS